MSLDREIKKEWVRITPYIQIGGYVVLIISAILAIGIYYNTLNSTIKTVDKLEVWHVETVSDLATIKQQVTDIHDLLIPRNVATVGKQ